HGAGKGHLEALQQVHGAAGPAAAGVAAAASGRVEEANLDGGAARRIRVILHLGGQVEAIHTDDAVHPGDVHDDDRHVGERQAARQVQLVEVEAGQAGTAAYTTGAQREGRVVQVEA